jgi:hypothetical protein
MERLSEVSARCGVLRRNGFEDLAVEFSSFGSLGNYVCQLLADQSAPDSSALLLSEFMEFGKSSGHVVELFANEIVDICNDILSDATGEVSKERAIAAASAMQFVVANCGSKLLRGTVELTGSTIAGLRVNDHYEPIAKAIDLSGLLQAVSSLKDRLPRSPDHLKNRTLEMNEISIDEMEFSPRTAGCLRKYGITSLQAITQKTENELLNMRNFGRRSLNEVREKLAMAGMTLKGDPPLPDTPSIETSET